MAKKWVNVLFTVWIVCGLAGCSLGGKPAVMVEQYALEYPPPAMQNTGRIDEVIRVDRFSVSQIFNNVKMVYRQKPSSYDDYVYHRWRANPGDMVGDTLLRDLRAAGIFTSVFSWRDPEQPRFVLQGGIGEFYESDEKSGRKAILSVNITLLDTLPKELTKQILFQRDYRYEEPIREATVEGFARAMSQAVEKFSAQVAADVAASLKNKKES